jgi:hypothetical protein
MVGLYTAQSALTSTFGDRVRRTTYLIALRHGVDPTATATHLEAAFLSNGMQTDAFIRLLHDAVSTSLTFDRMIEAFITLTAIIVGTGLGLAVAYNAVDDDACQSASATARLDHPQLGRGSPRR